ncbi:unnamed protein product [Macrosiphum euphorbiae]|uniref:Uncharacterized protein n=1 Tax=Macrosiphum euphorbiae TaxID=13131 RepID=A0AAV0WBA0_9HEMI|nr:unnamed protein product [Macrosiphum euphorbiae]
MYQKTHLGHEGDERELPHKSLNANEKLAIDNKLSLGVPLNVLLGQYESTQRNGEDICSRIDLLNYQDIPNISKQYNLLMNLFQHNTKKIQKI